MPDIQDYEITVSGVETMVVPRFTISGRVIDSTTGELIADLTGENSVVFPDVISLLSDSDRLALAMELYNNDSNALSSMQSIGSWILSKVVDNT